MPVPGKGGAKHKALQQFVKSAGEEHGYRATIEETLPCGGRVDVMLVREEKEIACEISVTTGGRHELANLEKCLAATRGKVVLISHRRKLLHDLERTARGALADALMMRVSFNTPEEFVVRLKAENTPPEPRISRVRGYTVRSSVKAISDEERAARTNALIKTMLEAERETEEEPAEV